MLEHDHSTDCEVFQSRAEIDPEKVCYHPNEKIARLHFRCKI